MARIITVALFLIGSLLAACTPAEVSPPELEPTPTSEQVEPPALTREPQPTERSQAEETSDESENLEAAEIREYQGEDLSSINGFRDNSISGARHVSLADYTLEITGLVENPLELTYERVLDHQHYEKVVTLHCVEGWSATILWEGVLVEDLLRQADVKDDAVTVIFHAEDGYTSSLSLEYVRQHDIMLAHKMNGVVLPPERGFPFQVVAESKWGYKWVKWVTKIELSDDADYRGYWESIGYNNDGSIDGPISER